MITNECRLVRPREERKIATRKRRREHDSTRRPDVAPSPTSAPEKSVRVPRRGPCSIRPSVSTVSRGRGGFTATLSERLSRSSARRSAVTADLNPREAVEPWRFKRRIIQTKRSVRRRISRGGETDGGINSRTDGFVRNGPVDVDACRCAEKMYTLRTVAVTTTWQLLTPRVNDYRPYRSSSRHVANYSRPSQWY